LSWGSIISDWKVWSWENPPGFQICRRGKLSGYIL